MDGGQTKKPPKKKNIHTHTVLYAKTEEKGKHQTKPLWQLKSGVLDHLVFGFSLGRSFARAFQPFDRNHHSVF